MKARVFDDAERPFRALKERVERNEAEGQRDETGSDANSLPVHVVGALRWFSRRPLV